MKKILVIGMIMFVLFATSSTYARRPEGEGDEADFETSGDSSFINSIFQGIGDFKYNSSDNALGGIGEFLTDNIGSAVEFIGYGSFAIATVIMGLKYMVSGVEGKSSIKEMLPTYMAGLIFFYFASQIVNIITGSASDIGIGNAIDYTTIQNKVIGTVNVIVQIAAFAVILFIGIKYMFESPDGKANIKERMVPLVIGMAFVFCSTIVVDFLLQAVSQTITTTT